MSSLTKNNEISKVCIITDESGYKTDNNVQKVSIESMTATNIHNCTMTGNITHSSGNFSLSDASGNKLTLACPTLSGDTTITFPSTTSTLSTGSTKIAFLRDEKATTTAGGTFTAGAWQTRDLNTEIDPDGIVSLSSNQFTLGAGTYKIEASAPAFKVASHQIKLRDITNSLDVVIGSSAYNNNSNVIQTDSFINYVISPSGSTTYEIQHRCGVTSTTQGFGVPTSFGTTEVYTIVTITQLS